MKSLSLLLLLLATNVAIQVFAQSGSLTSGDNSDTSEELEPAASGSGMRELPTPPSSSCHVPVSSNRTRGRMNLTEEERQDLMMEGRCYLACINQTSLKVIGHELVDFSSCKSIIYIVE